MNLKTAATLALLLLAAHPAEAQAKRSVRWEELTSADFRDAIAQSQGTCLLPFGILEKHGPHLPLGTDLLDVRYAALHAAEQNYAVVFPEYYFGQIFEAKHEPGTIAYSADLQLKLLQETADEMARNGCKKIIIVNGHGGNENLLPYFAQSQLDQPRASLEIAVAPALQPQSSRNRRVLQRRGFQIEQHKLAIIKTKMLREEIRIEGRAERHKLRFHAIHARSGAQRGQHLTEQIASHFGLR